MKPNYSDLHSETESGTLKAHCFRACDIRGRYPEQVNEDLFHGVGKAIAQRWVGNGSVLVGRDCRTASPALADAVMAGLQLGGACVLNADVAPTPLVNFGRRTLQTSASVTITASHNPPNDHGLKLNLQHGPAQPADIIWLERNWQRQNRSQTAHATRKVDLLPSYNENLRTKWRHLRRNGPTGSLRIVIDPGNGAWSNLANALLSDLGINCSAIHDTPDGRFPGRPPDCAQPGSLATLQQQVLKTRADAGFAWDGDGDRLAVVDDKGRVVSADQLTLLLLPHVCDDAGESVLLDVKMSGLLRRSVERLGMRCVIERSAHCALERTMHGRNCVFGAEYSGHYFFRELGGSDDGLFAALYVAHLILEHGSLSRALDLLPQLHITPDMRVNCKSLDFERVRSAVEKRFDPKQISLFDGVRVDMAEGWFLVRPSVSEDKLSIRAEGESEQELRRMIELLIQVLGPAAGQEVVRHYPQSNLQEWAQPASKV